MFCRLVVVGRCILIDFDRYNSVVDSDFLCVYALSAVVTDFYCEF